MHCLWTILTFFYTQGLNATPEPWPESSTDLLSTPRGSQGLSCSCLYFCRDAGPALQIRNISKATGQLLLHARRAEAKGVWTTKPYGGGGDTDGEDLQNKDQEDSPAPAPTPNLVIRNILRSSVQ